MKLDVPLLAVALALSTASVAHAAEPESPRVEAARRFRAAREAFSRGDFVVAAESFEAANRLSPHPATIIDAAEAWERAGQQAHAATLCERLVAAPHVDAKYKEAASAILKRVAKSPSTPEPRSAGDVDTRADGATVAGDASVEPAPKTEPAPAPPPPADTQAAPPVVAPSSGGGPPLSSFIAFGAAGVSAAVAGVFAVRTLGAQSDFDSAPTAEHRDAFYRDRTITNVAVSTAVGFAVVGAVLWIVSPKKDEARTARLAAGIVDF